MNEDTSRSGLKFNAKVALNTPKIFHLVLGAKLHLDFSEFSRVIASEEEIINKQKEQDDAAIGVDEI